MAFFRQQSVGIWEVAHAIPFRLGDAYHEVPPGLRFDSLNPLATRHLSLARVDLRDFAAAAQLEVEAEHDHVSRAQASRQVAMLLNEALAASGVPVLARARTWVVLSWESIYYQLMATDLAPGRRLLAVASRHSLKTIGVTTMLLALAVLPFAIGKLLPGIPFLSTAVGVGATLLAEWAAAGVWRRVAQRRASSPFAWL